MSEQRFNTALITGASSGIGKVYALELAKRSSCNLILTARRTDRLHVLKQEIEIIHKQLGYLPCPKVLVLTCDLSTHANIEKLINQIEASNLEVDLLVNNAGFGSVQTFEQTNLIRQKSMVEVNCNAPLHLIHYFLPKMIKRRHGAIINVCSTCSFQPMPYMATYGATKAFLYSLSTALSTEALKYEVQIMAHCPGPTESEFHLAAGLKSKLTHVPGMKTEIVVRQALKALENKKSTIINGWLNYSLSYLSKWLPAAISTRIVNRVISSRL